MYTKWENRLVTALHSDKFAALPRGFVLVQIPIPTLQSVKPKHSNKSESNTQNACSSNSHRFTLLLLTRSRPGPRSPYSHSGGDARVS